jgi:hypothetical protein
MNASFFVDYVDETGMDCWDDFETLEQAKQFISNIEQTCSNIHIYDIDGEEISL